MKNIRNFSIIAHVDHGKSTLANTYVALQHDLVLIPVVNKIDLAASDNGA